MLSFFVLCNCNFLSYIETLFPFYLGIPGAKIGLANVVTLTLLLCFGLLNINIMNNDKIPPAKL